MTRLRAIASAVSIVFAMGLSVWTTSSHAVVTVLYDLGTTNNTTALTGFGTTGNLMAGMNVTAFFADGFQESASWASLGFPSGQSAGSLWSLFESGDTFGSAWRLSHSRSASMTRLLIDAGPGDSVFDTRRLGDVTGTAGSARGWDFTQLSAPVGLDIRATYRDAVALTGFSAVGDLFRYLDLEFTSVGAFGAGQLSFVADTDNLQFAGDLTPVPEPGTMLLLSTGILGACAARRRRKA